MDELQGAELDEALVLAEQLYSAAGAEHEAVLAALLQRASLAPADEGRRVARFVVHHLLPMHCVPVCHLVRGVSARCALATPSVADRRRWRTVGRDAGAGRRPDDRHRRDGRRAGA